MPFFYKSWQVVLFSLLSLFVSQTIWKLFRSEPENIIYAFDFGFICLCCEPQHIMNAHATKYDSILACMYNINYMFAKLIVHPMRLLLLLFLSHTHTPTISIFLSPSALSSFITHTHTYTIPPTTSHPFIPDWIVNFALICHPHHSKHNGIMFMLCLIRFPISLVRYCIPPNCPVRKCEHDVTAVFCLSLHLDKHDMDNMSYTSYYVYSSYIFFNGAMRRR